MSHGPESGSAAAGAIAYPMLLECDAHGHVLWMSERTRSTLGEAENLVDAISTEASLRARARKPEVLPLRFSRLLEREGRVLISAQPAPEPEPEELASLEGNLLRHYFRLQTVEQTLARHARRHTGLGGRRAIRQIERERQRLGRELHTGVGQMLAAIRLQLEVIAAQLPEPPALVREALNRISTLAAEALEQVRSISRRLHPPEWQRLTLATALQQLWDLSGIPQRFEASIRIDPLPREPDLEIKVLLYRAAQEALSNLTRHARATRIEVALETRGDRLALRVRDNGVGFDPAGLFSAPPSVASGIGLRSIREQAEPLGARLEISSGPNGTTLEVLAPFSPVETGAT